MVTVAVRALAAVGVNVRLTKQLAPATTVAPFVQVVPAAMAKSPGFEPARTLLVMIRLPPRPSVRPTASPLRAPPRRWPTALRLAETVAAGGTTPVPASDTDRGLPG